MAKKKDSSYMIIGTILVVAGLLMSKLILPLLFVLAGVYLIWKYYKN